MTESPLPSGEGGGRGFYSIYHAYYLQSGQVPQPQVPRDGLFQRHCREDWDYTFDELAEDIALATTCTKGDIMAVLASIKPFITKALLGGQRVVLDDLGSLHISIQGKCYNAETMQGEDFSPSSYIRSHRVVFRPEVNLKKDIQKGFKLKRISSEVLA